MQGQRLRLAILLGAVALLTALGAGTLILLDRMHQTAEVAARDLVERAARIMEAAVNRHLLAVDGTLAGLPAIIAVLPRNDDGIPRPSAVSALLRDLNFQNFTYRDLLLVRPRDGRVFASALPGSRQRALPIDPAALQNAADHGVAIILGPTLNPTTGEWAMFVTRQVALPGAQGPWLAVAEVPVSLFATLLGTVADQPSLRLTIERANGQMLTSLPHDETRIGQRLVPAAPSFPADGMAREGAGRFGIEAVIGAARPTLYRDILVAAGIDERAAMADWRRDRNNLIAGTLGIAVMVLGFALALNFAILQRDRSEAGRAAARRVLENALESLADGFVMFDADDRLVICNRRYRDLYAVSAPFILPGARFTDIIREGGRRGQYPQAGEDLEAFVVETQAWHRGNNPPMERLLPDGRWILVTERRTPDGGTVGIRTDITALKQAMAELSVARDEAAAATEAKSRFLARMSHELRTPLNGVLGLAQVLAADPGLPEAARAQARMLEMAGRHLLAVANDVLDLARIEAGRLELHPEPAALTALLESCVALVQPAAEAKAIALVLDLAADLPGWVMADQTRLRQLVLNLLSNAVKFSPPGASVTLRARCLPEAALPGSRGVPLRIEVRDTGPGVPEAQRAAIFGDFVQLGRSPAVEGTGLGLAIATHIVERMGGRIGCTGNDEMPGGQGAVFWAEIPFELVAMPPALPAPTEPHRAAQAGEASLRILVVDDVAVNLAVASALLETAGHRVDCVPDGLQAIAAVQRGAAADGQPYDVVLLDVMMPGIDGLETARRIRRLDGPGGKVPIIAVTASGFSEDIAACRAAGMDGHLAKPLDRATLLRQLAEIRVRRQEEGTRDGRRETMAVPASVAAPFAALPLLPATAMRGGLARLVPGLDAPTALRIVPEFIHEIRTATEEIRQAIPGVDQRLAQAAHRLVGSAATLGAERLAAAARALETASREPTALAEPGHDVRIEELRGLVLDFAAQTLEALDRLGGTRDTASLSASAAA